MSSKCFDILINIIHGTDLDICKYTTLCINLNPSRTSEVCNNYVNVNFIHGNIWHLKNDKLRTSNFLYFGRIDSAKLPSFFLDFLKKYNVKIDLYGPLIKPNILQKYSNLDYKGFVTINQMSLILQNYKYFILPSITESLSLSLREAVLSGTIPIVYDYNHFTFGNVFSPYIKYDVSEFLNLILLLASTDFDVEEQLRVYHYNKALLDFEKFLLQIIFIFRSILLHPVYYKKNLCTITDITSKYIKNVPCRSLQYRGNTIDWKRVTLLGYEKNF